jgi:hypothetical protein
MVNPSLLGKIDSPGMGPILHVTPAFRDSQQVVGVPVED